MYYKVMIITETDGESKSAHLADSLARLAGSPSDGFRLPIVINARDARMAAKSRVATTDDCDAFQRLMLAMLD